MEAKELFAAHKPVRIITGEGCVADNAELFGTLGTKALIVSGRHAADKCGAIADVTAALEKNGITWVRFAEVKENPPAEDCLAAGRLANEEKCDFIIAIGGGSALDSGKAIAGYAANPECGIMDIFDDAKRVNPCLPLVAIPTTSGTGSEACRYSVLTIDGGRKKKTFKHSSAYARYSFVDPRYASTMNADCTVSTALDALAHAIESYFSPKAVEASAECALFAAGEIWDVMFRNEFDAENVTAEQRARLAYAACAAGIAIDYTGTGFPHPLGYSITLTRGIPHGKACAVFEGAYLEYNMLTKEGRKRAESLAEAIGTTVDEMKERIPAMSGVKLSIGAEEREELIDRVAGAGNYANSPYVISRGEMSDIYERFFG